MEDEKYDSTKDYEIHKENLQKLMYTKIIPELHKRAKLHDCCKLEEPEKSGYDKFIPLLRKYKFGSPEYNQVRKDMKKECLDDHFKKSDHHIEHFENGIEDMDLLQLIELVADQVASSWVSDTNFEDGHELNRKKYNYPDIIYKIIKNTYERYLK